MKKVLALSFCLLMSTFANAQIMVDESYVYQEPYVERSYGKANWSYVTAPRNYQQPVYTNGYSQARYSGYTGGQTSIYQGREEVLSPVFKRFYATLRAGVGGTFGWDENEKTGKVSNPVGAILSISLGAYLKPNVRLDGEFAYHTKDDLYKGNDAYLEGKGKYSQYDFGVNLYYDFNTNSEVRPFVGLGIWGISSKVTSDIKNVYGDTRDTSRNKTNFAVSGALGVAYQVNDLLTLEAMARARYIFSEDIYNLEGLLGSRFSF